MVAPPNCARSATKNQVKRDINRILDEICEVVERKRETRRDEGEVVVEGVNSSTWQWPDAEITEVVLNVAGESRDESDD